VNGAELLVSTLVEMGIDVCFANPGTTEMPIVMALDSTPGIRAYLGLFEGVCTGAADGYGRMLDKPAVTLLHLGPGFANGIANLHNARRAQSPLMNVVGEHATWHRDVDPPLAMDIESLVKTVSAWYRTNASAQNLAAEVVGAVASARLGQVSTLIVPHDHQLAPCHVQPANVPPVPFDPLDPDLIEAAAIRLRKSHKAALLLGGRGLRKSSLAAAARIKKATGCDLFAPTLPGYLERGAGLPLVQRIPYFPEQAMSTLSRYDVVLLVAAHEPVTFFGYPGVRSRILSDQQQKIILCSNRQNVLEALESLSNALGASAHPSAGDPVFAGLKRPSSPQGQLTPEKVWLTLGALQPEDAIIVDEAISSGFLDASLMSALPPHCLLTVSGGSIGQGIPCASGAAIACPERPVINLEADGSGLYTVQGLWTQAREGLNVTTLICSNRSYRILQMELNRAGIASRGPNAHVLTELTNPALGWVEIARGFGVPGVVVSSAENLGRELGKALAEPGPHLIEMLLQ
jgi:acetolactate synthase I/II/III large subunit